MQPALLAFLVALGCAYGLYGLVAVFGGVNLAYRLVPLEFIGAIVIGAVVYRLFQRVREGHSSGVRPDQAERAIERLAYRRRRPLTVQDVASDTLLDEPGALLALEAMVKAGSAERVNGAYRIRRAGR